MLEQGRIYEEKLTINIIFLFYLNLLSIRKDEKRSVSLIPYVLKVDFRTSKIAV